VLALVFLEIAVAFVFAAIVQSVRLHTRHLEHWEWGNAANWFAAVGTVGTLTWVVSQGLYVMARSAQEKRLEQARRVSAWTDKFDEEMHGLFDEGFGRVPWAQQIKLTNSSGEAVYEVVAYLVWVQGSAPRTGEATETHYRSGPNSAEGGIFRMRAIVQVLPPGNYRLDLAGPTNTPMQGRLSLEVAFTDGAGRHWVRRVPTGNLEALAIAPVAHYGITRPIPTYNKLEPW
jgi:hypothetical protein